MARTTMAKCTPILLMLLLPHSGLCGAFAAAQTTAVAEQDTVNRTDENGRKTGWWRIIAPNTDRPGYPHGALVEEGQYTGGKRSGAWKRYWPNGKLMSEVSYKFGVPRGHYRVYYPSGKLEEEGDWDLDRNTGAFKRFHPNGKPAQEFVFDAYGQRDGVQKYYHENGQLAVEVTIKQGKESGTLKRWYPNGDLEETATYANGDLDEASRKTYAPKKPLPKLEVATEAKVAPAVGTGENTNAMRFRENGFNTLYDKQLRITQTGEYREGRLWNGRVYRYGSNGMLIRIEVYIDGRYVGNAPITDEDLK
jgi:antitoxin component YwqK of YwqJK toxin-antitoxin module